MLVVDPARPTFYVELRGTASLLASPDCTLEREVSIKYTGGWGDAETEGTMRYAATMQIERITSQQGHGDRSTQRGAKKRCGSGSRLTAAGTEQVFVLYTDLSAT